MDEPANEGRRATAGIADEPVPTANKRAERASGPDFIPAQTPVLTIFRVTHQTYTYQVQAPYPADFSWLARLDQLTFQLTPFLCCD